MAFKTDCGGKALTVDCKLSKKGTTWNTRLSQIGRNDHEITIVTYSLCNLKYISQIVGKRERGAGITIICNSKYEYNGLILKRQFPELKVYANPNAHAKLVLIAPETVWLSSENFGHNSDTFDATIGIHNTEAYDHYYAQVQSLLRSTHTKEIKEVPNDVHIIPSGLFGSSR